MQNPNEDTEWNDVLRAKGILPPKDNELTLEEDTVVQVLRNKSKLKGVAKCVCLSRVMDTIHVRCPKGVPYLYFTLNSFTSVASH